VRKLKSFFVETRIPNDTNLKKGNFGEILNGFILEGIFGYPALPILLVICLLFFANVMESLCQYCGIATTLLFQLMQKKKNTNV